MRRPPDPRGGPSPPDPASKAEHGAHTLRVWQGVVVGVYGNDVFVELGPRVQGVIALDSFDERPELGSEHAFTLRGQEEGLWALARVEERSLATWETLEVGSLVHARIVRTQPGGLEAKVGPLHAFLPKSQTGLPRDQRPDVLVGKTLACEVVEVDRERQRCLLSRKLVLAREKGGDQARAIAGLRPGQVVHGRVTRVESFGAFVSFGRGLEGLVHVSNLSWERVAHASEVLEQGADVEVVVLTLRRGGKRIGLGLKQLQPNPCRDLDRAVWCERVVRGHVTRTTRFGVFVRVRAGIEGLMHVSESGCETAAALRGTFPTGAEVPVRVLDIDPERERMSLSSSTAQGARLTFDDVSGFDERAFETAALHGSLGHALRAALSPRLGPSVPTRAESTEPGRDIEVREPEEEP